MARASAALLGCLHGTAGAGRGTTTRLRALRPLRPTDSLTLLTADEASAREPRASAAGCWPEGREDDGQEREARGGGTEAPAPGGAGRRG